MRAHNLGTVLAFELRRTLAKPSFWVTSLSVPVLMVIVGALMWFSNTNSEASIRQANAEPVQFTYADASGIVQPTVAARLGGTPVTDAAAAARAVREGRSEMHLDIPADPARDGVRIVGADKGLIASGQWHAIARDLLEKSAEERIADPQLTAALRGVPSTTELWKDGARAPGLGAVVAPGLFLVLLYMGVLMLGQQMLNITVEEKENRVTEMILTTIDPRVLLVGKVGAVLLVGLVQGAVLLVPATAAAVLLAGLGGGPSPTTGALDSLQVAGIDVVIEPVPLLLAAGLFTGGFLLFTGLLVAVGSVMPTAKDAGTAFGAIVMAMFLPLYAGALVVSTPDSPVSEFLTWFPLTAPVTALLRNATGSLSVPAALGVTAMLFLCAALFLGAGVRLFRQGSISYDKRLNVAKAFRASRS